MKINWHFLLAIVGASVGPAFQHGYNLGVINSPHQLIKDFIKNVLRNRSSTTEDKRIDVSDTVILLIWSTTVSIFCVGGMVGAMMTRVMTNKFGIRGSLLVNGVFTCGAALSQGFSKMAMSFEMIILGRFLVGISAGLGTSLSPMYLSEISPVHLRGAVSSVYPLMLVISIFISQVLSLKSLLGTVDLWPLLLAFTVVPCLFMLVTLPFCPASPRFLLIRKGLQMEAEKSLAWLRGTNDIQQEFECLKEEDEKIKNSPKVTLKQMFVTKSLRIPLIIVGVLMTAQQLSGVNAINSYSSDIFKDAKFSDIGSQYATLAMGAINIPLYILEVPLIEMAGRKTLLLMAYGGLIVDSMLLTITLYIATSYDDDVASFCCVGFVLLYMVTFAIGAASVPMVLVNELFSQTARPFANCIGFFLYWLSYFIVSVSFLSLKKIMGIFVLLIFVFCQLGTFIFVLKLVPETKQKPINEIIAMFEARAVESQD